MELKVTSVTCKIDHKHLQISCARNRFVIKIVIKNKQQENLTFVEERFLRFLLPSGNVRSLISRGSHMLRFHSAFQPSNETITSSLLISTTVQAHQTPSSSSASALKPTVCGSAIAFVNRVFSSQDHKQVFVQESRSTCLITLHSVARILSSVQCPSAILVPHCACVDENLNYTLCPC